MRVLFEGQKYKVIDANDKEIKSLLGSGIIKQVNGVLVDEQGRIIVITKKGIVAHSDDNPFPYLVGETTKNNLKIYIKGSVARADKIVVSNYHVLSKARTLVFLDKMTRVILAKSYKPILMSRFVYALLSAIKQMFHIDLIPISSYDYAIGVVDDDISNYNPNPQLIYFAGTCTNINEDNCFGYALPIPSNKWFNNAYELIGSTFTMNCTAHGFTTQGEIIDYGKVVVNYDGKLAVFDDAFMLKFIAMNGIPGCSGSAIHVKTLTSQTYYITNVPIATQSQCDNKPYSTIVNTTIEIKPIKKSQENNSEKSQENNSGA